MRKQRITTRTGRRSGIEGRDGSVAATRIVGIPLEMLGKNETKDVYSWPFGRRTQQLW
ncbi:MAG TPA: hypothetical protein QGH10_03360 [Armatimonadota bacterium]|jgi:hypothetical protein|nr:hypothetical protein [Armatimonadota bacterium]